MEFLSSPVHNYSYETFEDGFFEVPKEMDFEVSTEFRDSMSHSMDEDNDLNDGMYGVWSAKHPWTINNNSSSIYNSNLHLDFIGGDPESAIMVNPNIVIPSGFQFDEETTSEKKETNEAVPLTAVVEKTESKQLSSQDGASVQAKKVRIKLLSAKESIGNSDECNRTSLSKSGIRILKPIESSSSSSIGSSQQKIENTNTRLKTMTSKSNGSTYYQEGHFYPKPAFSYSCLIAMALKNSRNGCLPVAEIYNFMCNHFPYFKTAPNGWKNSVRHNLSLNKCFEKIEKPAGSTQRKGCLWALNPSKAAKLEEEVQKCTKKDVTAIKRAMEYPEHLELLERGELKSLYDAEQVEYDDEDDIDLNDEDDTEMEEPAACEELVDERFSEDEPETSKTENESEQYPVLNVSGSSEFPEFKIEVDDSIYEELIGSIKRDQLFALSDSVVENAKTSPTKKVKKYFIEVNRDTDKNSLYQNKKSDPEIFDHYDINNLLRFENETKLNGVDGKTSPQRFNRRVGCNSRIKQIKFKTWN